MGPTVISPAKARALARHLYKNRGRYKRAARTIGRAYRSYRSKKNTRSKRIRGATAVAESWSHWYGDGAGQLTTLERKTLYASPIRFCRPPTDSKAIGSAPFLTFGVKGFKLCVNIVNQTASWPTHVHLAIVQPKQDNINSVDIQKEMFRTTNNAEEKYIDFVQGGLWDPAQDCMALSKEKFNIITHIKMLIAPTDGWLKDGKCWRKQIKFDKYFKMNGKKFQFENGLEESHPDNALWLLLWHESTIPVENSEIGFNINTQTYLTKPKLF